MRGPLFSILVPTRERLDTLRYALKTCLAQDCSELEIVVCDNYSSDGTSDYVSTLGDPRLKLVKPAHRLGMSQNWEFGLSRTTGQYVTIIGDDDGLVPGAVERCNDLIRKHDHPDAVVWQKAYYSWPSRHDHLSCFLAGGDRQTSSAFALEELFDHASKNPFDYTRLPCLYNSFVKREVIDRARSKTGRFFNSMNPDIFSAIALAAVTEKFIFTDEHLGINGASNHSNGSTTFQGGGESSDKFKEEDNIPYHSSCPVSPSIPIACYEALRQVEDHVDGVEVVSPMVSDVLSGAWDAAKRFNDTVVSHVAQDIKFMAELHDCEFKISESDYELALMDAKDRSDSQCFPTNPVLSGEYFSCPAAAMNIHTVEDAANLIHQLKMLKNHNCLLTAGRSNANRRPGLGRRLARKLRFW